MKRVLFYMRRVVARTRRPATAVFAAIYAGAAFYMFHRFILGYVQSSFLSQFLTEQQIGIAFSAGAGIALLTFFMFVWGLRTFGAHTFFVVVAAIQAAVAILLAFTTELLPALIFFVITFTLSQVLYYSLDVFIELYSRNEAETGRVRGTFLTVMTVSAIAASLLMGLLVGDDEYWKAYLAAAVLLLPMIFIVGQATKNPPRPKYREPVSLLPTATCVMGHKNLRLIMFLHFLLQLAFSWFVVYIPLYLIQHVGFDWLTFGSLVALGFVGYIVTEYPAGWIADNILGEKELLVAGFIILAGSFIAMSFITAASVLVWGLVFFVSRVGAGFVESMSETFFFKHVDGGDTNTMALFRMLQPLSVLIGPLIVSGLLLFAPFQYVFMICGLILLVLGLLGSLGLDDTR